MQKPPTINQINGRLLNQPGIAEYLYHSSDKQRYSNHYKQRYFDFCYEYEGKKVTRNLSIIGNFLFCAAIGSRFKTHIKRLIDKGLIHKDTYKFTGMAVPTGNLSNTISEFLTFNEVTV